MTHGAAGSARGGNTRLVSNVGRVLFARRGWLLAGGVTLVALLIVPQYLKTYRIHGPSDAPNYLWDDLILVNRTAYDLRFPFSNATIARLGTPGRGDVVLLRLPDTDYDVTRRIIGLPGETVEVRDRDGSSPPARCSGRSSTCRKGSSFPRSTSARDS